MAKERGLYDFFYELPLIDGGKFHLDLAIVVGVREEIDGTTVVLTPFDEISTLTPAHMILEAVTHVRRQQHKFIRN